MSRYDLTRDDLSTLLADEPAYRATQVHEGLFRRLAEPNQLTELPRTLRERLALDSAFAPALEIATEQVADGGRTRKWLFRLADGAAIETVLMHYPRHATVCVSSQAGCAMACTFCATGDAGFSRQLSAGEILEQVVRAARAAQSAGQRLDHVVFMGMGEPLSNYGALETTIHRLVDDVGLGARHLTVSTVGVIPGIRRLAADPLQVNLAISLHAARDQLRDTLVPLNRRYPIEALIEAAEAYFDATHRRISLEWALMDDVNDTDRDAEELALVARRLRAHVNLIPLNPTVGGMSRGLRGSPRARVLTFRQHLTDLDVNATIRQTRGQSIDAACGQLAGSASVDTPTRRRATAGDRAHSA
jgi:23S rRNA (adenine2503-C2)-methyltransferase